MTAGSGIDSSPPVISSGLPQVAVTVDTRGRVRTSQEQRRLILAEWERRGESLPRFAQRTGLKYSTLARWVQQDRHRKRPGRPPRLRLLEAVVAPAPLGPALPVQLPGGARLELRELSQVPLAAALVRALEQPC